MSLKKAIFLFVVFSFIIPVSAIQQTPNSFTQAAGSQAGAASAAKMRKSVNWVITAGMMLRRCAMTSGKCTRWSTRWRPIWRS